MRHGGQPPRLLINKVMKKTECENVIEAALHETQIRLNVTLDEACFFRSVFFIGSFDVFAVPVHAYVVFAIGKVWIG